LFKGHVISLFLDWRRFAFYIFRSHQVAQIGSMPCILLRYAPSICN
jgi:hypothetical protein